VYDEDKRRTAREQWMLELPPEKAANLGLGPRQFRKREAPDMSNRSEWTDTPSDKLRKVQEPKTSEISEMETLKQIAIQKRDEQMEHLAKTSEKQKPYSLLEMHQEKLKKQQKVNLIISKQTFTEHFYTQLDIKIKYRKINILILSYI